MAGPEFFVSLLLDGSPSTVAYGDANLGYIDLVRVWGLAAGDDLVVECQNVDTDTQEYTLTMSIAKIG